MKNPDLSRTVVIIPSYLPPENLLVQVDSLRALGFINIIVVNDGSPSEYQTIFDQLKDVIFLSNHVNKGKGDALKLAYRFILEKFIDCDFAISCDDDGQHHPEDVLKVASVAIASSLRQTHLGSRAFTSDVPLKSLVGNLIMEKGLCFVTGIHISDTQTGLRCIPTSLLPALTEIPSDKFNFEFSSLLFLIKNKHPIKEVPIRTIYFNNNRNTRFKGFKDSLNIVGTLLSYYF